MISIPHNPVLQLAQVSGLRTKAFIAFVVGLIACIAAAMFPGVRYDFLLAYLTAFVFWSNIALGCLALLMIQYLSGGAWGLVLRRVLETGAKMCYWIPVLWLPIGAAVFFHDHLLYEWTSPDAANDPILKHKQIYLNVNFWLARSIFYFVIWAGLAYLLRRWSRLQDETGDQRYLVRMRILSGPGVVLYALTITFAAIDWLMSLQPHWYSTMYGPLLGIGQLIAGLAFSTIAVTLLARIHPMNQILQKRHMHDYGKFMLGFTMVWAYLNFSQLLIIWSGNLIEEIPWYLNRLKNGWQWMGGFLIAFHFIIPFVLLLQRPLKKNPKTLIGICAWMVFMRLVDTYYHVIPSSAIHEHAHPGHGYDSWRWWPLLFTVAAMAAVGGLWLWQYLKQLTARPLLPLNDPFVEEALDPHGGGH